MIKIVLDAMGGDFAPQAPIEGAVQAISENDEIQVILVGKEDIINKELSRYSYDKERIQIVNANEIIVTGEDPVDSIRKKKDSSLVVGMMLVRQGLGDAFVSAGNTGSVLVGAQVIVGREKNVLRAPIAAVIPTEKGFSLLLDSGANVDAKPQMLVQFAIMGDAYSKTALNIKEPKVALLNIGAEEDKGNALTKETYQELKKREDLNFIGNIEANEVSMGKADVIVCDAFAGNMILKMYEGVAATFMRIIKKTFFSSLKTKIGALLIKSSLKEQMKAFDTNKYGGSPLLGLKGSVVKAHGNSKAIAFKIAILQCIPYTNGSINKSIRDRINS